MILDNPEERFRLASEPEDLDPGYSFNDDEVELSKTGVKGLPSQIRESPSMEEHPRAQSRV